MLPRVPRQGAALVLASALLAACDAAPPTARGAGTSPTLAPEVVRSHRDGPPGAEPGTCWGEDLTPAHVETITEHVMLQPPGLDAAGNPVAAVLQTETRQRIVREREPVLFRTPCDDELTPVAVATLQRALAVRGLYTGPVTGTMDAATRQAVRAFQRPQGLDSGLLSLRAARQLGIVAFDFSELRGG